MFNPFKRIFEFNKKAGLLDDTYSSKKEIAYLFEEALEGFNLGALVSSTDIHVYDTSPREVGKALATLATEGLEHYKIEEVDIFDKHLDSIVFNIGALYKLGLSPQQVQRGLEIVAEANMKKLGAPKDDQGKQLKPAGFVPPEDQLQLILDKRS